MQMISRLPQDKCDVDPWYECEGTHNCNGVDNVACNGHKSNYE